VASDARVYTHRFVYTETPVVWAQYRVPEGMRAVVKSVVFTGIAAGGFGYVKVHGLFVFVGNFPVELQSQSMACTVVAYGGELIECAVDGESSTLAVCGFLFKDDAHESFPPSGPVTKDVVPLEGYLRCPDPAPIAPGSPSQ
jgi:hypothetical protein